jgi:hypothetical protein
MADIPGVSDYLAGLVGRRWQPGAFDCAVFMADWVYLVTGRDPIADVRGRYSTERQFLKIVRHEGGFEAACARRLAACGYVEAATPGAGDIVAVLAPFAKRRGVIQRRPTGAIATSGDMRAVATSDLGIVIAGDAALPVLKAWTLANG